MAERVRDKQEKRKKNKKQKLTQITNLILNFNNTSAVAMNNSKYINTLQLQQNTLQWSKQFHATITTYIETANENAHRFCFGCETQIN